MKQLIAVVALLAMTLNFGCALQRATDDVVVVQKQYDELVKPIVRIKGSAELPDGRTARWTGSGVVVYSGFNELGSGFDTYILTCNHVVETPVFAADSAAPAGPFGPPPKITGFTYKVDYVEIFNPDGTSRKVSGIVVLQSNNNIFEQNKDGDIVVKTESGQDEDTGQTAGEDLALVRLNTIEKLPAVKMMPRVDIDKLRVFFKARVVGCSLGGRPYHTFGEITVLQNGYMSVNAQFVPGNSGGAAYLDSTHEFIGITNAGPNPVWHMGLIRPLQRIYDWMDRGGYTFIYDKLFDNEKRLQTLRVDRDRPALEEEKQIKDLFRKLFFLNTELKTLSDAKTAMETTLKSHEDSIRQLQERVDLLKKAVECTIKAVDEINKHTVDEAEMKQLKKQLEDIQLVVQSLSAALSQLSSESVKINPERKQTRSL